MAEIRWTESELVKDNVKTLCKLHKIGAKELARIMCLSLATMYERLKTPDNFRLGELELLAHWSTKKGIPVTVCEICGYPGALFGKGKAARI